MKIYRVTWPTQTGSSPYGIMGAFGATSTMYRNKYFSTKEKADAFANQINEALKLVGTFGTVPIVAEENVDEN